MKTEKEEKILKEIALRFPNTKHKGLGKYGLYLYQEMDLREVIKLTLQERNSEVKQAIDEIKDWRGYPPDIIKQKLGLEDE